MLTITAPTSVLILWLKHVAGGAKSATSRITAVSAPVGTDHTLPAGEQSSALDFLHDE